MKRITLLLALALGLPGCFPTFPDENAVKNLRTLAIQQDPAVAILDGQSIPQVTLRALVVDPLDLTLEETTNTWTFDLPDDFEGADLVEGLLPEGPWDTEVALNFAALLGGGAPGGGERDSLEPPDFLPVDYNAGLLPITHFADNGDKRRESLKFVNFLVPDFESIPTPPTVPGTRPQQAYLEALAEAAAAGPPESWNANPNIVGIKVNEGEVVFEREQILEHTGALSLGAIEGGAGLRFDVVVEDDKDPNETDVEFYWTHGAPGLPVDPSADDGGGGFGGLGGGPGSDGPTCYEPKEGDPEAQDGEGFGGGAGLSEPFEPDRAFGWTAPCSVLHGPVRLFLIARDGEGGVAWQEMNVTVE
jgi:hypothetical protein